MTLRIVGAGVGRTGTMSLKLALERLLGGPCYHMVEAFDRPDHIEAWHRAARGEMPDWAVMLSDYRAVVDWPACSFWPELSEAFPDALVLLSVRHPEDWWRSADRTIFAASRRPRPDDPTYAAQRDMALAVIGSRFTPRWSERDDAVAAYQASNARVRETVPPERLVEWRPGDGWGPLCEALGVPSPDEPFPHANTTAEFRQMVGLDEPGTG